MTDWRKELIRKHRKYIKSLDCIVQYRGDNAIYVRGETWARFIMDEPDDKFMESLMKEYRAGMLDA